MRNRYFLTADLGLLAVAALAAFFLRFDFFFYQSRPETWSFLVMVLVVKPAIFYQFGVYRRYWQYASIAELSLIVAANVVGSLLLGLLVPVALALNLFPEFSRAVLVIDFMIALGLTGGFRFAFRMVAESNERLRKVGDRRRTSRRRVLIAGAGEAGIMVARESVRNPQLGLDIVGFIDDDPLKHGKDIAGVRVLGAIDSLPDWITRHRVDEVVIAMPAVPGRVVRAVVDTCRSLHVRSRTVPGVFELLSDRVNVKRLRDVQITDLLRRSQVEQDVEPPPYLVGRTVLVTGAGGSVGSELCRQVAAGRPQRLVLFGHGENSIFDIGLELREQFPSLSIDSVIGDIRDGSRVRHVFDRYKPDIVFHAAAHKHVPLMEANPEEAVTNNIVGTARVLDAALRVGSERFVLVSSDKAVAPSSIMGATKRVAEHLVRSAPAAPHRQFVVVRFGNVLGSRGSVVPRFRDQIAAGGPITITHPDMTRYFMTIPEAAHLILQAGGFGHSGNAYVLNMGDPVKIVDLARDMVRLSGLDEDDVPIVFTSLRPGEKLHEELWEDDAPIEQTEHADVFRIVEPLPVWMDDAVVNIFDAVRKQDWLPASTTEHLVALCRRAVATPVNTHVQP